LQEEILAKRYQGEPWKKEVENISEEIFQRQALVKARLSF